MIFGSPTTRAVSVGILLGVGALSVALRAAPARAEVPRAEAPREAPPAVLPSVVPAPSALTPTVIPTLPAHQSGLSPVAPFAVVSAAPSAVAPAVPTAVVSAAPSAVAPAAPPVFEALDVITELPSPVAAPRRPRFEIMVGMGGSFDSSGLVKGRTVLAPAFLVQVGVGDGPVGFQARLLSTQTSGRFHQMCNGVSDMATDRLAIDFLFALRPFASKYREIPTWIARFARSLALDFGASGENASLGAQSAFRIGIVVGTHIDLPVTPAGDATELRVRVGVRRMIGGQDLAGAVTVSDTVADVFGGLAVVF